MRNMVTVTCLLGHLALGSAARLSRLNRCNWIISLHRLSRLNYELSAQGFFYICTGGISVFISTVFGDSKDTLVLS